MIPTYPPLEAYRRDVARLGPTETFGPDDGEWLAASLVLQRYVEADAAGRQQLAADLATYLAVGDEVTVCDAALRVALAIEKSGALHLAASWLALLERVLSPGRPIDAGRVITRRAGLARKFGNPDESRALYEEVETLGRRHAEPELTARAWLGYGLLAQMRGNYPEARRWFRGAALVADDNSCREPGFNAHLSLMTCAALAREWNIALREGWIAYRLAARDSHLEAEVLTNLAQALCDLGQYRASIRGFAAAVAQAKYNDVLFPALGGLAMSAARIGAADIVAEAARYLERSAGTGWPYLLAAALIELSDASLILGRTADAERYRARAAEIATARGFHELTHRIATPSIVAAPEPVDAVLDDEARRIIGDIERIDAPAELVAVV